MQFSKEAREGKVISEENTTCTPLGRWERVLDLKAHQQKFGFGCFATVGSGKFGIARVGYR